jgi:2-polyprenyl-6-methoxyphenol hydroxylase-like FAD-dependent oxidoreductase
MMAAEQDQILVVGGGPVGLAMALSLAVHGMSVRIIDRDSEPTDLSKALVIWARTLEVLDGLIDADRFIEAGITVKGAEIHHQDRMLARIDLMQVRSRFKAGLFLPQSTTEKLLIERLAELGVVVERETELLSFTDSGDHVDVVLRDSAGVEHAASTPWLLGCDGSHSTVRHGLGLDFPGGENPERFVLGDVHVDVDLPGDRVSGFFHHSGVLMFFPIVGGRFRVFANTPEVDADQGDPTMEELQAIVTRRVDRPIRISDPHWLGAFRIRDRVLESYRSGRCLLAGDSAHVHSPAGGQGMNTGIQDAVNLGWKLALHSRGIGSETLIDSYSEERAAVGRKVVSTTTRLTDVVTSRNPFVQAIRNTAIQLGSGIPMVQKMITQALAMIVVNYRNVGIRGNDAVHRHHSSFDAGDRVPYRCWSSRVRIPPISIGRFVRCRKDFRSRFGPRSGWWPSLVRRRAQLTPNRWFSIGMDCSTMPRGSSVTGRSSYDPIDT